MLYILLKFFMKKFIISSVFIYYVIVFPCFSIPKIIEERVSILDIHNKTLALESRFSSVEVAHIVDKDGTLTNTSSPMDQVEKAQPRGHADLVLKSIIERGSPVAVSSAWDNFDDTLSGLKELGLGNALQLSETCPSQFVVSGCGNGSYRDRFKK